MKRNEISVKRAISRARIGGRELDFHLVGSRRESQEL
jgi:hypothetical protein